MNNTNLYCTEIGLFMVFLLRFGEIVCSCLYFYFLTLTV